MKKVQKLNILITENVGEFTFLNIDVWKTLTILLTTKIKEKKRIGHNQWRVSIL